MMMTFSFVSEKGVWGPNFAWFTHNDITYLPVFIIKLETVVNPCLSEGHLNLPLAFNIVDLLNVSY